MGELGNVKEVVVTAIWRCASGKVSMLTFWTTTGSGIQASTAGRVAGG